MEEEFRYFHSIPRSFLCRVCFSIFKGFEYSHFSARSEIKRQYKLLTNQEAPKPGTLVAMDAEFVMLQQEETEIISDGTKSLVRPKQLSLARVSVIRGEGPEKGVPFIDDFIITRDVIVDYLTEFSGIEPGDLDPSISKRALVTLQTSYKRLWLLLNLGCVFIGHGLHNDFRTISEFFVSTLRFVLTYLRHSSAKVTGLGHARYLLSSFSTT